MSRHSFDNLRLVKGEWSYIQLKSGCRNNVEGFRALGPITTADSMTPVTASILQVQGLLVY